MNILDHFSQSLKTIFWVKVLNFLKADAYSDLGIFLTLYPGWKNSDPQHCIKTVVLLMYRTYYYSGRVPLMQNILDLELVNSCSYSQSSPTKE